MLMLMVFIGQATAASNDSCQMSAIDQNNHLAMADMVNPVNLPDSETGQTMNDCCNHDCNCPLGDCSSVALISSPHHGREMIAFKKNSPHPFLLARQFPAALYRPPISR